MDMEERLRLFSKERPDLADALPKLVRLAGLKDPGQNVVAIEADDLIAAIGVEAYYDLCAREILLWEDPPGSIRGGP